MTETPDDERQDQATTDGSGGGNGKGAQVGDTAGTPELTAATPDERAATAEAERDEMKDRMLRIAADFENWKKRARKEQTDAEARVRESVLKDVLEVVDSLERATIAYPPNGDGQVDGAAILKGVNLILRVLQGKLERHGVRPLESKGQPFDPRVHEAISQLPTDEVPPGSVAAEFQKGYRIGDKLLRPASVAVAVPPKDEGAA